MNARFLMVDLFVPESVCPMPSQIPRRPAIDRVHRRLLDRLAAAEARRREIALSPGSDADFEAWNREVRRINRLRTALRQHLAR